MASWRNSFRIPGSALKFGDVSGLRAMRRGLESFVSNVDKEASLPAIRRASKVVVSAVRDSARAVKRTGTLAKSISSRAYRARRDVGNIGAGEAIAVVGPRRKWVKVVRVGNRLVNRRPSRYAHLSEAGFTHRSGKAVKGREWFKRGMSASQLSYQTAIVNELEKETPKALDKATRKFQRAQRR